MNYTKDEYKILVESAKNQMQELGLPEPHSETLVVDVQAQIINALIFRIKNLEQKMGAFVEQTTKDL